MRLSPLLLLLLLAGRVADACQCGHRPGPLEALPRSIAVFDGTVIRRSPFLAHVQGSLAVLERNEFLVHYAWRGPNEDRIVILTGFSNCDYLFDVGTRYVVFARFTHEADIGLESSICLPTDTFRRSEQALSALGPGFPFQPPEPLQPEARLARAVRVTHSAFLWGVVSSVGVVNAPFPIAQRVRFRFLIAPLAGLSALTASIVLIWRRRFRLLAFAAPLLLLATLFSIAVQGYVVIRFEPMLSYWILERVHGA